MLDPEAQRMLLTVAWVGKRIGMRMRKHRYKSSFDSLGMVVGIHDGGGHPTYRFMLIVDWGCGPGNIPVSINAVYEVNDNAE